MNYLLYLFQSINTKKPAITLALEKSLTIYTWVTPRTEYHHQNHHNWREQVVMPLAPRDDYRNC